MCVSDKSCGRFLICFFVLLITAFLWIISSGDYSRFIADSYTETPLVLETNRLPLISEDRKIIYVVSKEGLPIAHNFILRNPSLPIEKIVFRKPGPNSTLHVFPIQRDGLWATNDDIGDFTWIGVCTISLAASMILVVLYMWKFKDLSKTYLTDSSKSYDGCCEVLFDTSIDILDDQFNSPMDSPLGSPIKSKAKMDWKSATGEEHEFEKLLMIA